MVVREHAVFHVKHRKHNDTSALSMLATLKASDLQRKA